MAIVVCMKVSELKKAPVPSSKKKCAGCGVKIWVSLRTIRQVRGADPEYMCIGCATRYVKEKT